MNEYRVGITATQEGVTGEQLRAVSYLLRDLIPTHLHHGDCIGGDEQTHHECRWVTPKCRIVIHPPLNESKRAFCQGDEERDPYDYLDRNKHIVQETGRLIAMPKEFVMQQRSGTWSTFRYAKKRGHPIWLILPDGSIEEC